MRRARNIVLMWGLLLLLGATAFGCSFLPLTHDIRLLQILPGVAMAMIIALGFMEVGRGGTLSIAFSVAALFWLAVLLGLGTLDPLTRLLHPAALTLPG